MAATRLLGVLPCLLAVQKRDGRVVLERRFLSGMAGYQRHWDGRLAAILEPAPESELKANQDRVLAGDDVEVDPRELPFELRLVDYRSKAMTAELSRCSIATGGIQYRQVHLPALAKSVQVPLVLSSEYTLRTRLQIVQANGGGPLVQARRALWEVNQERLNKRAVQLSSGLQANGTPTFDAYGPMSKNAMLFFDNRIEDSALLATDGLEARLATMRASPKLRLVFAGRINRMKGADQLLDVARHLREMGADFELHVYGGGVLANELAGTVERDQLGAMVKLMGHVPFAQLLPKLQNEYDLFVCCHPQGDPAMAYLETMSAGLPVVGYANEALAGLLARVSAGRSVPIYDNRALALLIRGMSDDRARIADWSRAALAFARDHSFERTFKRRIEHIQQVVESRATSSS